MTTNWKPENEWAGETVAILGNGPAMTRQLAESMREHKTIAVHRAVRFAPWADMFVALDPEHHAGLQFEGMRVVGAACDADALFYPAPFERVRMSAQEVIEFRSNLLASMRIAAGMGAAHIVLCGIDTQAYEALHDFRGLTVGLEALTAELTSRGIVVARHEPQAAPERASE